VDERLTFPLLPRRRVAGLSFGAMRSRLRGGGVDLAGARPYRPGDDVRRIDWRTSARLSSVRAFDEFVVREHLAEEATRVVVAVDPSPSMALFPPELPWLSKARAVEEACAMIAESAIRAGCLVREPYVPYDAGDEATLSVALAQLAEHERELAAGTFVFLISDFLQFPPEPVWERALATGWDLVPVVVQDPLWEQSFPDVAGAVLPLVAPAGGRLVYASLTRAEVRARREEHEARLAGILDGLEEHALDWVLLSSDDRGHVLEAFLDWSRGRHQGARLAR
jgi:uncharacterized protein (DUF58 family)